MRILDINKHPCNAASVLQWMLYKWDESPNSPLLVITSKGDGKHLINRVRVRLSNARSNLRKAKMLSVEFTIKSSMNPWGVDDTILHEAVTFEREITMRHRISELLQDTHPGVS